MQKAVQKTSRRRFIKSTAVACAIGAFGVNFQNFFLGKAHAKPPLAPIPHEFFYSTCLVNCRQCLIALRGERDAQKKSGADLPSLSFFFFFLSHAFSVLCLSFSLSSSMFRFLPYCPSFSEQRLHHSV